MFEDFEHIVIDMKGKVICDYCDKDWTGDKTSGGFLFQSKAVCPDCEEKTMNSVKKYHEERFIRGTCPNDVPFGEWILGMR